MVIDRAGYTEDKLSTALANPDLTRDQKDFEISMYLYQRGAHNTSMLVDLFRYKGAHTKETRVFKSQIRFDFEQFVNSFTAFLDNQARLLGITLDIDIQKERREYMQWLDHPNNKGQNCTYLDFFLSMNKSADPSNELKGRGEAAYVSLIEMAIQSLEEADVLRANVRKMADARMRDKGKGIYISTAGVPYTMNDPQLDDAIKADRESTAEAQKDL